MKRTKKQKACFYCHKLFIPKSSHKQLFCSISCGLSNRNTTHGMCDTDIYRRWLAVMGRCYDSSNASYPYYGGRGIIVCSRWHDPAMFILDMSEGFSPGKELDRFPNNTCTGHYQPGNVRWVKKSYNEQNKEKKIGTLSKYKGVSYHKGIGKWIAYIGKDGVRYSLGTHSTEIAAAKAYDRKAMELYPSGAWLNFPIIPVRKASFNFPENQTD